MKKLISFKSLVILFSLIILPIISFSQSKSNNGNGNNKGQDKWDTWSLSGNEVKNTDVLGSTNNQSLKIITNDSLRMEIKNNGDVQVNKNMGITGKLDVGTINNNSLSLNTGNIQRLFISPAGDIIIKNNLSINGLLNANTITGNELLFKTNNLLRLTVLNNGDVKAENNMNILGNLQIDKNVSVAGKLNAGNINSNTISLNTYDTPRMLINPDGNIQINKDLNINGTLNTNSVNGNDLILKTGNTPRFSILGSGVVQAENDMIVNNNMKIKGLAGAPNFVYADIDGTLFKKSVTDTIKMTNMVADNAYVLNYLKIGKNSLYLGDPFPGTLGTGEYIFTDANPLYIQSNDKFNINTIINANNSGKVGIGINPSSNPEKLQVDGSIRADAFILSDGTPITAGGGLWTKDADDDIYRTVGNVGIKNNDPKFTVDVSGDINFTGKFLKNGKELQTEELYKDLPIIGDQYTLNADAFASEAGFPPNKAIDGNLALGWYGAGSSSSTPWFSIGLDEDKGYEVNKVVVHCRIGNHIGTLPGDGDITLQCQPAGGALQPAISPSSSYSTLSGGVVIHHVTFLIPQISYIGLKFILSHVLTSQELYFTYSISEVELFQSGIEKNTEWHADDNNNAYYDGGSVAIGVHPTPQNSLSILTSNNNATTGIKISNPVETAQNKFGLNLSVVNGQGNQYGVYSLVTGNNSEGIHTSVSGTNSHGIWSSASGTDSYAGYFVGKSYFNGDVNIDGILKANGGIALEGINIDENLNVGIGTGTTEPKAKLDVEGNVYIPYNKWYRIGGSLNNTDPVLRMTNDGTNGYIDYNKNLYFRYGTNTAIEFTSDGKVYAREVNVTLNAYPDYVFYKGYKLKPIHEVECFINSNGHLPDVPTEKEATANGVNIGEMNSILLKKVEELTLYLIDQNKKIEEQQKQIDALNKKLSQ